jgi:Leucine-rich repeat (LRR) protein
VTIPDSIGKLGSVLRVLEADLNQIKYLPVELGNLEKLQKLKLYGNCFPSFPCSFARLSSLQEFTLEWFKYTLPVLPCELKGPVCVTIMKMVQKLCF